MLFITRTNEQAISSYNGLIVSWCEILCVGLEHDKYLLRRLRVIMAIIARCTFFSVTELNLN